jgi:hypothetical protein
VRRCGLWRQAALLWRADTALESRHEHLRYNSILLPGLKLAVTNPLNGEVMVTAVRPDQPHQRVELWAQNLALGENTNVIRNPSLDVDMLVRSVGIVRVSHLVAIVIDVLYQRR